MFKFNDTAYATISSHKRDKIQTLRINNKHCDAEIAMFGAHLLSFSPKSDGIERIWLSELACFDKSKAIRGGVPICWPWFADLYPKSAQSNITNFPAHGFVRDQDWHIVDIQENENATTLILSPNELGLFQYPSLFSVMLQVTFAQQCTITLISKNDSKHTVDFTAALHTYFTVSNIKQTEIKGVEGSFIDKTQSGKNLQLSLPYLVMAETDRIHSQDNTNNFKHITIVAATTTTIVQSGHDSVVIWNPWKEKSRIMSDIQNEGYQSMLCVEASVTEGISLAPEAEHQLIQIIG
ncbi:MAG: glucose-6-phosphate 1-epimerase [Glaciecola sp.]|jgi:glucose-6-phosphate 1-epimerase